MDGSAGRFNFAARWTLISVPNVRFRGYRWMWWCCTVFFATYQAAKRGCMIAGSDRGRIAPHYRSQQPRRCVSLLAAQIGIVWGAKARRPVWSLPGGFAVRLAHASHAERNRVMGRAVNWSRKAHQTQGTLMRTVHLTGASLLLLGLLSVVSTAHPLRAAMRRVRRARPMRCGFVPTSFPTWAGSRPA